MPLRRDRHDRVLVLTLDDPERRNAITDATVEEIVDALEAAEGDDGLGALVVTGAPPAFCAGADVGNLARLSSDAGAEDRAGIRGIYEGFLRVARSSLPTVAAVNGPAVGAGCNLALACDVRLVGRSARFDSRFASIGLHPGGGHLWMLERAVGPQTAAAMAVFGEVLDAPAAVERGLAWAVHDDDTLVEAAIALAARAATVPKPLASRLVATLRAAPWQPDFEAAITTELTHQTWSFGQGWFRPRTGR